MSGRHDAAGQRALTTGAATLAVLCSALGFSTIAIGTVIATRDGTALSTVVLGRFLLGAAVLWRIGQGGAGLRHWVAFGGALAFGTLAKGPVIFVHLLPVLLTMRLWAPVPPRLRDQLAGLGLAVAAGLAIVGLWLVPALVAGTAEFRRELLWTQSAARVAGGLAQRLTAVCAAGEILHPQLTFAVPESPFEIGRAAGPVSLDETSRLVTVDGVRVDLSPREFALLECLLRHRGQVLSRDQLLDHAWPYDSEVTPAIVDTYVYFLRRKLGPLGGATIETARGVGYRIVA